MELMIKNLVKVKTLLMSVAFLCACQGDAERVASHDALKPAAECNEVDARDRRLALNRVQARLTAEGGASGQSLANNINVESAPIYSAIAKKNFAEACLELDKIAQKYGISLFKEMKGATSSETLSADASDIVNNCSVADAAEKQMELHTKLQEKINSGEADSDIMRQFAEDTQEYGVLLTTNSQKACDFIEQVALKYNL